MQDQITNRIALIMNEQHEKLKTAAEDVATFVLVVAVLALGVVW